jgi:hypothetical protein
VYNGKRVEHGEDSTRQGMYVHGDDTREVARLEIAKARRHSRYGWRYEKLAKKRLDRSQSWGKDLLT